MKMRKRRIALLLTFVMLFSIFSGSLAGYAAQEQSDSAAIEITGDSQEDAGEAAPDMETALSDDEPETAEEAEGGGIAGTDEQQENQEEEETQETEKKEPQNSGEQTMETHSLQWFSGSSSTVIEENKLTITPKENGNNTSKATAQLNFSFGGENNMPAGAVTIRLPRHIFYARNGSPIGTVEVPLAKAPAAEGVTGFHYFFDEETDEIVLTNFTEIPSSYFFNCQIAYKFTPYNVKNGYTKDDVEATFEVKLPEETEAIRKRSESLTVQVNTAVPTLSASKTAQTKYEKWQSEWGEKPADAEKYFYVLWRLQTTTREDGTQPYKLTLEEKTDAVSEVIGWYKGSRYSNFTAGDKAALKQQVFCTQGETHTFSSHNYSTDYVVVKYPRATAATQEHKVTNEYTAVVTGVDGDEKKASGSSSYTYKEVNFKYSGDKLSVRKSNGSIKYGGINELEAGLDMDLSSPFYLSVSNRGYGLTKEGTASYTTCLEDKQLYIKNERLTPEDYSFTKFYLTSFEEYEGITDDEKGYVGNLKKDYESYRPIEVYVRTRSSQDWEKLGEIQKEGGSSYSWNNMDGSSTKHNYTYPVILPEGTYDISFRHTGTQYEVSYGIYLYMRLHVSKHILGFLKDQNDIACHNICSGYTTDEQGVIQSGKAVPFISEAIKKEIVQVDTEEYGQTVMHDYSSAYLTRWKALSEVDKRAEDPVPDPVKGQESVVYIMQQYDYMYLDNKELKQAAIDSGAIMEHRDGVFYDLLPAGTTADVSSVCAWTYHSRIPCPYSLSFEENWRGSGRTMMQVHVTLPKDTENFYWIGTALYSGFRVEFTLINTWENIHDYGSTVRNSMAYYSNDGNLAKGRADDGGSLSDKDWFYDLDGDGNTDPEKKNVMYDDVTTRFAPLTASELGFRKAVKTTKDITYGTQAEAVASGEYTYQLRFGSGTNANTKDVVMYDVLERAWRRDMPHWQGTLKGINITQAQSKGIDVKIYYSTSSDLGKITTGSASLDLKNKKLWSQTAPKDLSKVTAIAIDLSHKTDGSEYIFKPQEVALCYVTMAAPVDVDKLIDNPDTQEDETVYAYNSAYIHTTSVPTAGGIESEAIEACSPVRVSVREADIEIHKTSSPESGDENAPALVKVGETIDYILEVTNNETAETMQNIRIEDKIPAGLTIDNKNIKCYFGEADSEAELVSASKRVSLTAEGQKLIFTVDKLAGKETVHLLIPTQVSQSAAAGKTFKNTAEITEINNKKKKIQSEIVWHKTNPETVDVTVNKVWEDYDNAYQTRPETVEVQLYADGKAVEGKTAQLNAQGNWSCQFTGLSKYKSDGSTEIQYTARETTVLKDYDTSYSDDGRTVTNTLKTGGGDKPDPAKVTISAKKTLNDAAPEGSRFTFVLKEEDGKEIQTVNNNGGDILFDPLEYKEAGTYTYMLTEKIGEDDTIRYDSTVYTITVQVTESSGYKAEVSYKRNGEDYDGMPVFKNVTKNGKNKGTIIDTKTKGGNTVKKSPPAANKPASSGNTGLYSPKTGENINAGAWSARILALLAGILLSGSVICIWKNRRNR